jgi:hypothetical protein
VQLGVGAQEASEQAHEESRADSLVADVGDGQGDPAVGEREGVVEVAADLAGGVKGAGDLPSRGLLPKG